MHTKEQVQEWVNNVSKNVCNNCNDNCCNCKKHAIIFTSESLGPFVERNIPVLILDELSPLSQYLFLENKIKTDRKVETAKGKPVPIPSIVQCRVKEMNDTEDRYEIYAQEFCPLYKGGSCTIHEDSRRPKVCKNYPVQVNDKLNIATILSSCREFNREDLYKSFRKDFPEMQLVDPMLFRLREARELQLTRRV